MPMEFFSQRLAGDIQNRSEMNATIASTLVNTFAPLMLNTVMMVFYLLLMIRQNLMLTLTDEREEAVNAILAFKG